MRQTTGGLVPESAAQRPEGDPPGDLGILVVDDESGVGPCTERILRGAGYRAMVASSGADAIRVAARMPRLDVLVTDVMMPGMHGDELARRLSRTRPALKVLYLTDYCDRFLAGDVVLREDQALLEKPCSIGALRQAVAALLGPDRLEQPHPTERDPAAPCSETALFCR